MKHILIGKSLLIKVDEIVSANLTAKDKEDRDCIEVVLTSGTKWTIWSNLNKSREVLRAVATINDKLELIETISNLVYESKVGRESNLSKKIKQIL